MHCRRQHRADRGIATSHRARRSTLVGAHWATPNYRATRASRVTVRATLLAVIVHRTFRRRSHRRAIHSTIEKHRRRSRGSAVYGTSATHASWIPSCNAWVRLTICQSSSARLRRSPLLSTKAHRRRRKTRKSGRNSANWSNKCGRLVLEA